MMDIEVISLLGQRAYLLVSHKAMLHKTSYRHGTRPRA